MHERCRYIAFWEHMQAKYGMDNPVRQSYGKDDPEVRGIIDPTTDDLLEYADWILTGPDDEPVRVA